VKFFRVAALCAELFESDELIEAAVIRAHRGDRAITSGIQHICDGATHKLRQQSGAPIFLGHCLISHLAQAVSRFAQRIQFNFERCIRGKSELTGVEHYAEDSHDFTILLCDERGGFRARFVNPQANPPSLRVNIPCADKHIVDEGVRCAELLQRAGLLDDAALCVGAEHSRFLE
jgi:hypothetical protein